MPPGLVAPGRRRTSRNALTPPKIPRHVSPAKRQILSARAPFDAGPVVKIREAHDDPHGTYGAPRAHREVEGQRDAGLVAYVVRAGVHKRLGASSWDLTRDEDDR